MKSVLKALVLVGIAIVTGVGFAYAGVVFDDFVAIVDLGSPTGAFLWFMDDGGDQLAYISEQNGNGLEIVSYEGYIDIRSEVPNGASIYMSNGNIVMQLGL